MGKTLAEKDGSKNPLFPPFTRGDNPSGHDEKISVKEANIVPLVKGEAEEDLPNG